MSSAVVAVPTLTPAVMADAVRDRRRVDWRAVVPPAVVLALTAVVSAWKMGSAPLVAKDEGVYMSQAWAVTHMGSLANYTYWYDHPPLGWVFLSAWLEVTGGLARYHDSVDAGREFMVVLHVVTTLLVFLLARRLKLRASAALVASAAFGLSPLSVYFGRLVLLDNIAIPFVLAAFVLATSPRRRTSAFVTSALLMGIGVLCKETVLLLAPMVIWTMARHVESRRRLLVVALSTGTLVMTIGFYPLYATLKNELLPGSGHVSLAWAVKWQLFSRASSGSVFDAHSDARVLVDLWTSLDSYLLVVGILGALLTVSRRSGYSAFRPVAVALVLQIVMVLRPGYLPFPYVIALLPFAAVLVGVLVDGAISVGSERRRLDASDVAGPLSSRLTARRTYVVLAAGVGLVASLTIASSWFGGIERMQASDVNRPLADTRSWIETHTPRGSTGVVEASLWLDLVDAGRTSPKPIWMYKLDQDPEVRAGLGSWRAIDYIALQNDTLRYESAATMPTMFDALSHSSVAAQFGTGDNGYTVYVVDPTS